MPAQVIPTSPGLTVPRYSVIGMYSGAKPGDTFVQHLALLRDDTNAIHGDNVSVWDMRPPLIAGQSSIDKTGVDSKCPAHVVGWISLTSDEREGIEDWLAEADKYSRPGPFEQYTVSLQKEDEWHKDERGVRLFRRFSCVSFVLAAYKEGADVVLVDTSEPGILPEANFNTLAQAFGENFIRRPRLREKIGLSGHGPWRVILAGYVYHSLVRPEHIVRATPFRVTSLSHAHFPSEMIQSETQDAY